MSINILGTILFAALITACISGIFGMAGGLIFMGVLASFLGVAEAMVVHGIIQSISNSYRSFLLRGSIRWDIIWRMGIGAIPALALLAFIAFVPTKGVLFLCLGLLPLLLWVPKNWFSFDAQNPLHAVFCGFCITGLNLVAGVAGPALDMFFVRTEMPREEIVATKAFSMFISHMMKIFYFGIPLVSAYGLGDLPPMWFFMLALPLTMIGTFTGTRILKRMSDIGFRQYTKWLVSAIGMVYFLRGVALLT